MWVVSLGRWYRIELQTVASSGSRNTCTVCRSILCCGVENRIDEALLLVAELLGSAMKYARVCAPFCCPPVRLRLTSDTRNGELPEVNEVFAGKVGCLWHACWEGGGEDAFNGDEVVLASTR